MRTRLHVGVLVLGLLLGCSGDPDTDEGGDAIGDGDGDGDGAGDGDGDGDEPADPIAGRYELTSRYDLTASPLIPNLAGDALASLTGFSENPAGALIDILEQADLPILEQLLSALPGPVVDQFENFVNDYIFERVFEGIPLTQQIAVWSSDLSALLTHFDIVTGFSLSNLEGGASEATHVLAAVSFPWNDQILLVDTPDLVDTITMARDVDCAVELDTADGAIEIGEHAFNLPLGDFAVVAFNMALQQTLGVSNLRAALGLVVDCAGLAENVANRCIGPVCVGHEQEIGEFCDAGLDLVVAQVEARLAAITFTELRMRAGGALLRDAADGDAADGVIDHIDEGTWETSINVNGVAVPVDSPFVGVRVDRAGGAD